MDKKKPILHILMETKSRELEGRTLLALEAASRGFTVIIGHKIDINEGLKNGVLPPGIYFEKSLTKGKEKKLSNIAKMANLIVSQDEEGGLLDQSFDKFLSIRSTPETVDMAKCIFCWGHHDYNAWEKRYIDCADKIYITGSPRTDFWRHDFKDYFKKYIDSFKQRYGRFVLISSNFVSANGFMSIEERIAQGKRNGSIRTPEDEQNLKVKIFDSQKMFNKFIELINHIAKQHKHTHFVVRPHPAEKLSGWKDNLLKRDNVHVIFEGGISSWVHASIAVLHNGCTTGMEAYAAGVPAIAYVPFESSINREIPNRLSIKCAKKVDVSLVLSRIINGEYVTDNRTPENDNLIKYRLSNVRGAAAAQRIVDVLETLNTPVAKSINPSFVGWKIGTKKKIKIMLKKITGKETKPMRKFPGIKLQELIQIRDNLTNVNGEYKKCDIRLLYGDVYLVEKNARHKD